MSAHHGPRVIVIAPAPPDPPEDPEVLAQRERLQREFRLFGVNEGDQVELSWPGPHISAINGERVFRD